MRRYIQSISVIDNSGYRDQFYLENLDDVYQGIEKDYLFDSNSLTSPTFTKGYYSSKKQEYFVGYIDPIFQRKTTLRTSSGWALLFTFAGPTFFSS